MKRKNNDSVRLAVWVILSIALINFYGNGQSQTKQPFGSTLRVKWSGKQVIVAEGKQEHVFDLADDVNAASIVKAQLLASKKLHDHIYLLFNLRGFSNDHSSTGYVGNGYCGGGEEANFVWLDIDNNWSLLDSKSILYESSRKNVDIEDESQWGANAKTSKWQIELTYVNNAHLREKLVFYDLHRPELGLREELE